MVYLLKTVIFHGYVSHNQMVTQAFQRSRNLRLQRLGPDIDRRNLGWWWNQPCEARNPRQSPKEWNCESNLFEQNKLWI